MILLAFLLLFVSSTYSQAEVSANSYACVLFCSDGKRIVSQGCYLDEQACHMALSTQAGACSDIMNLQIFGLPFVDTGTASCQAFIASLLTPSQSDSSLQTTDQVGKASCGCTDLVSSFLTSVTYSSGDFCTNAIQMFLSKVKVADLVCGKVKFGGLFQKFCSALLDESGIINTALKAVCGFAVEVIKKTLGFDIQTFFQKIQNDVSKYVNKTSSMVCGMLLCSSTANGCTSENYSGGVVATITETVVGQYCSLGGIRIGMWLMVGVIVLGMILSY